MNKYRLSQNWNPDFLIFKPMLIAFLIDQDFFKPVICIQTS